MSTTTAAGGPLDTEGATPAVPPQAPRPRWTRGDTLRTALSGMVLVALLVGAWVLNGIPGTAADAGFSLLIGAALGIAFERGRFCFFCIFRDAIEDKDTTGVFSVLVALAVGGLGYAVVFGMFLPDPTTGRLPPEAHIGPVSWVLVAGGLAFGVGMTLSGACISGHLYRLGQGYTRAVPALLGALVGFGLGFFTWNTLYFAGVSGAPTPWLPTWFGYSGAVLVQLAVLLVIGALLLRWARPHRTAPLGGGTITWAHVRRVVLLDRWGPLTTGAVVGVIGVIAYLRVEPLGVTAQLGTWTRTALADTDLLPDRLHGLDTLSGCATVVTRVVLDNGWLILGLVLASFAAALAGNRFRPSPITVRNGSTALLGGVLMGWGAMVALGCTVGVLLSGIQAFAVSGWVFAATVLAGTWVSIRFGLHRS
ncbi:YeeE/YedE family protein [Cellulomonas bogoriensis]|uniref:YeeE/YedE family protein n=1 Tax=Cellulomonas bogoriensis TaxID=301388 RepID=UPI0018DEBC38|nr:YeeE/YedE family protein [Cellulomonas bogoriensis]